MDVCVCHVFHAHTQAVGQRKRKGRERGRGLGRHYEYELNVFHHKLKTLKCLSVSLPVWMDAVVKLGGTQSD